MYVMIIALMYAVDVVIFAILVWEYVLDSVQLNVKTHVHYVLIYAVGGVIQVVIVIVSIIVLINV
jgi:hypothetical protein